MAGFEIVKILLAKNFIKIYNLFKEYISLTTIEISSSVKTIGSNPFIGCNSLTNIIFESNKLVNKKRNQNL